MKNRVLYILLLLFGVNNVVLADELERFATFTFENDFLNGDDGGDYTNAISYSWGYAGFDQFDETNTPDWIRWLSDDLYINTMPGKQRAIAYQITQIMLTPEDIRVAELQETDIPYSGLLLWKVSQYAFDENVADKLSLTLGVVGPLALAEQTQKMVHEIVGATEPLGWDNQLKNEPVFKIGVSRKWRLLDGGFSNKVNYDAVGLVEAGLGNLASHVDVGVTFRIGTKLAGTFPAVSVLPGREINPLVGTARSTYYLFISAVGRYLANSVVIDGNTFRHGPSVTMEHGQNIVSAGVSVSFGDWSLLLSVAHQSKTFKESSQDKTSFGSLSVSWGL